MKSIDAIKTVIFNSNDYMTKGSAVELNDIFFYETKSGKYVVFIAQTSSFDGNAVSYKYAFYSVSGNQEVEEASELYHSLISILPQIHNNSMDGAHMDFYEKRRLRSLMDRLIEFFCTNNGLSNMQRDEYRQYLMDMKKMKSSAIQMIYDFFIAEV